jgi:hypothetical protein
MSFRRVLGTFERSRDDGAFKYVLVNASGLSHAGLLLTLFASRTAVDPVLRLRSSDILQKMAAAPVVIQIDVKTLADGSAD